jgi:ABC-type multidrug transport system permease subunit
MLVQDSETVRICAVLHYVLEDTPVTREDLLREGFSLEIVTALEALSERPGEDYELFINRILGNELACRVKAADIGDNMNLDRLAEITAKDLERVKRYQRALEKITANKGRDSMNPGELFLREHGVGHTFRVVGNSFLNIDKLLTLPEQALRTHPQGLNSLAWLFWDMTRVEDGCLAAVVAGVEQVLDQGDWAGKLGVSRRDVGTGMSKVEAAELSQRIAQDLSIQTEVSYRTYGKVLGMMDSMTFSFNYSAYVLISLLILGVSSFMLVFNQPDLRKRNLCSPVSLRKQNSQVLLGNLVYATVCWVLMMLLNLSLFGGAIFVEQVYLFALNAFVFTIVSLSMGFLVGNVTRSRVVQSAISNVTTTVMCFLGGVFVPQALLSKSVVSLAKFLPTYWYVRANNEAGQLARLTLETLTPILGYMAIQLGMAVAFLAVALVIIKQKQQSQTA